MAKSIGAASWASRVKRGRVVPIFRSGKFQRLFRGRVVEHAESTARSRGVRPRAVRLALEALEDRIDAVDVPGDQRVDPGGARAGSFRWAVAQANLSRNQGSTVAITPAVPGRDHPPRRRDSDSLEHDDRERLGAPVDDSAGIPELAGLPCRRQPANDRGDHHRAERRQHPDPDGRARAQRKRRGHPRRQPEERFDPGVRQRGRELGRLK